MSILIKGIDMPRGCDETCPLYLAGQCCEGCDCPLVEIPTPHGRLIDEKALKGTIADVIPSYNFYGGIYPTYKESSVFDYIDDAPTIVEAEGR